MLKRWFPTAEEEAEADLVVRQQLALNRERIGEFIKVPFMADFKKWLRATRLANEPQVGEPNDMIYRTGLRDGIRAVEQELEALERKLQEE